MGWTKYVFETDKTVRYRFPTHTNELIMDRSEAETSEAFIVVLQPGESTPLHLHHDTEQIFYILRGTGVLQIDAESSRLFSIKSGNLVRIPPHTFHLVHCDGQEPLIYLSIDCFIGGRPLDEPTWESHVRAICRQNGWDFDQIRIG